MPCGEVCGNVEKSDAPSCSFCGWRAPNHLMTPIDPPQSRLADSEPLPMCQFCVDRGYYNKELFQVALTGQ